MKNQIENPNGLHARYSIRKIIEVPNPKLSVPDGIYTKRVDRISPTVLKTKEVDKGSEYFVLRLDTCGSDIEHIKACRVAVNAYAEAIKHHLPRLSEELIKKYPLL